MPWIDAVNWVVDHKQFAYVQPETGERLEVPDSIFERTECDELEYFSMRHVLCRRLSMTHRRTCGTGGRTAGSLQRLPHTTNPRQAEPREPQKIRGITAAPGPKGSYETIHKNRLDRIPSDESWLVTSRNTPNRGYHGKPDD